MKAWTLLDKRENYILLHMEAWILLNKKRKLYITEDNKDADGSMDSVRRRELITCTYTRSKD
jgi:hypothetical protein